MISFINSGTNFYKTPGGDVRRPDSVHKQSLQVQQKETSVKTAHHCPFRSTDHIKTGAQTLEPRIKTLSFCFYVPKSDLI